jgi:dihydropteroate synthase
MGRLNYPLPWGTRTFVMGILNITPDSFSGDGLLQEGDMLATALDQARRFVAAGADILDIGAESTRPGAQVVSLEEEKQRVFPVIEALRREIPSVLLSIDTYKAEVAQGALDMGADWVNDVWALRADERMASVVARYRAPVILMHNRSHPSNAELQERLGGRYIGVHYDNLLEDIKRELMQSVEMAHKAGVKDDHIILDPGIGFGKTREQNLELLNHVDAICELGFPVMVGSSRKSFIGYTLDQPADERVEGTAATVAVSIMRGADIVRVHDVEYMVRVARMTDAIVRKPE